MSNRTSQSLELEEKKKEREEEGMNGKELEEVREKRNAEEVVSLDSRLFTSLFLKFHGARLPH